VNEDTILRGQRQASANAGRNQSKQLQPKKGQKKSQNDDNFKTQNGIRSRRPGAERSPWRVRRAGYCLISCMI
jgi:hypothetical protein